jgi:hypothetical protein
VLLEGLKWMQERGRSEANSRSSSSWDMRERLEEREAHRSGLVHMF